VTFGAPAELVTGADGAALEEDELGEAPAPEGIAGPATTTGVGLVRMSVAFVGVLWVEGVITSATEYGVMVFATGCSFLRVVGAMLTFTAATGVFVSAAADVEPPPVTLAMLSPLVPGALAAVVAGGAWVRGTAPFPGVPMPGNTVPCCRLPVFGCAAEGFSEAALATG